MFSHERPWSFEIFFGCWSGSKFTRDVLVSAQLCSCQLTRYKPLYFPIVQNHKLGKTTGLLLSYPNTYRHLFILLLLASTWHISIHILSQFMHQPRQEHWNTAICFLWYLKGPLDKVSFSAQILIFSFMHTMTMIRPIALLLVDLLLDILFLSATLLSLRSLRNNIQFLDLRLKPNIGPWRLPIAN